jgi:tetratricopeptide (TPR) repeat protein
MTLRALRVEQTAKVEGAEIPSWVPDYPLEEQNVSAALCSGVKSVSPDDTARQQEAPRHARRSGAQRRTAPSIDAELVELEARYRAESRWDDLVNLYLSRIELLEGAPKAALLEQLADVVWEELRDATAATDALVEALAIDPECDGTAEFLESIAVSRDGGWTALVDAIAAKILLVEDNPTKARLAERVVRWARGEMNDPGTADRFLASMRTFDPAHPLVHQRLATVYGGAGAWDSQREALVRALSRAERDEDRRALLVSLGQLHEDKIPNSKLANEHYELALTLDPCCMPALEGLERLCRIAEQYARLAEILDAQVDAGMEAPVRAKALVRLGELLEHRFVRPREALEKYALALEIDPSTPHAADGLERCWQAVRDWGMLATVLERRAANAADPLEAIAALERLGEVRESKQQDLEGAFTAWRRVYELDTCHATAIQRLARLCEKQGDVTAAAAYRARLADLAEDPREKARIHVVVGEMLAPPDRDPACARIHFERAVEMDPRNAGAWEQLQKLAEREGDMMYATFCLERRAEQTESARAKAVLLVELARLRASLGDSRGALATFEYAFETDATNEAAARAVLEDWSRREKWQDAQRACEVLLAAATRDGDARTVLKLLRLSTRIALAVGDVDRALVAAAAALDMSQADAGARDDLLHVCHEVRGRPELHERIRTLVAPIAKDAMDLPPASLVRLGEIRVAAGDPEGGAEMLRLALSREGDNPGALASLCKVFVDRQDWGRAANCMHRLARVTREPARRQVLFLEAADLWEKRARAPSRAVPVLEEALGQGPGDAAVLWRLVGLWDRLGEWDKLAASLQALGHLEDEPVRRAKHVYASAGVVRERIRDVRRAAMLYEEVLGLDPRRLDAFEHIVRIWTDLHDWPRLEAAYHGMLGRMHDLQLADKNLEHALYHQLGLIYRDRLGDLPRALDAFRRASLADPRDEEDRRIIVELLVLTGQTELAIADMRASLQSDATRPSAYRELYELLLREGASDEAWWAANVLCHLKEADEQQQKYVTDFPPMDPSDIPGTLAAQAWESHLVSGGVDGRLDTIFRVFVPAVIRTRMARVPARSRAKWLGAQVTAGDSPTAARLVQLVRDTAEVLGLPRPLLLARPKLPVPLSVAPTPMPALFVSLPAVEGVPPDLLPFLVARRLSELRPEMLAHALFPTLSEIKSLLKTAVRVAVATRNAPPKNEDEARIAACLEHAEMEELREAVSRVVGAQDRADLRRWHQQADLSISRAALLLTGDMEVAWRAMQREGRSPSDLAPKDWRAEMLRFAVSREHADLRDAIGVSVESRAALAAE